MAEHPGESDEPTRLYIEGEQVEFDGSLDDIVEMAKSVGGGAFVYVPTKADQEAAAARLAAQDQAIRDASGALPQVTLDFDPRHSRWDDAPDPLWLLTADEFDRVPDGSTLISISGERKVKGVDYIDQDSRFGCIAWGFLESQLGGHSGSSASTPRPLSPQETET